MKIFAAVKTLSKRKSPRRASSPFALRLHGVPVGGQRPTGSESRVHARFWRILLLKGPASSCPSPPQWGVVPHRLSPTLSPAPSSVMDDRGALGGGDDSPGVFPGISPGKNKRHFLLGCSDRNFLGRVSGNDRDRSIGRGSTLGNKNPRAPRRPRANPRPPLTTDTRGIVTPAADLPCQPLQREAHRVAPTRRAIVCPNHEFHSVTSTPKLCTRLQTT